MSPRPSGRLLAEHMPNLSDDSFSDPAVLVVAFDRVFRASVEDVWKALVDPQHTAGWYGSWRRPTSDPDTVELTLKAEPRSPVVRATILECDPGRLLRLWYGRGAGAWGISASLDSARGRSSAPYTTLTLVQSFGSAPLLERLGPRHDYYLDRLLAYVEGDDVEGIRFQPDYYPDLVPHYQALVREAIAAGQPDRDGLDRDDDMLA